MKSLNLILFAVIATLLEETADAFTPRRVPSRTGPGRINPSSSSSSSFHTTVSTPSLVVMQSSQFGGATPNDQAIREEYNRWRQRYYKGEFDAYRYENFKANFMAVTVRNNMERTRALQNGESAPSPIALNEYGDCSADEYRSAMGQPQQSNSATSSGPRRVASANSSRPAAANTQGLNPSNTIVNSSSSNSNNNSGRRTESLANASAQLRATVQQRTGMESELAQMKKILEEKKKILANASKEEQVCLERIGLREEQKRLLNDRLTNGWEDERGMNNY